MSTATIPRAVTVESRGLLSSSTVKARCRPSGAQAGEVVEKHGVRIVGHKNVASRLASDASALFARNLYNFLSTFWDKEAGKPVLDEEIGDAVRLTKDGQVVNARLLA